MTSIDSDETPGALDGESTAADTKSTTSTRRLSLLTLATTLALVAVGGYTRGSGSGFGCEDRWPLCEDGNLGGLLPRWERHMIIEWTHRWVAATVGLLALATAVSAWRHFRRRKDVLWLAITAVLVIIVQAYVGRMVVTQDLDADLVSVHLAISMVLVALITITTVNTSAPASRTTTRPPELTKWMRLVGGGAGSVAGVLLLGSYVHNLYISGWPLVGGVLVPEFTSKYITVHFFHRVGAALAMALLLYLTFEAKRRARPAGELFLIRGAAMIFAVNIGLGAAHVFTEVGSGVLIAVHLFIAEFVWTLLVATTARANHT